MPVPSAITDLSATIASNSPAGSDNVFPDLDNFLRAHAGFIAQMRDGKGFATQVSVASASTVDLGAQSSMFVEITGTTTITSFGSTYNGPRFVRFAGALTLTHNATTLILPTGANITTEANQTYLVVPNSTTGWRVLGLDAAASFLQSGTGAVSRTVQSKLRDVVSVLDFGAVGDGVADDTVAIQAAVATQKPLYWPAGTYLISGTVGAGVTGSGASYGAWFGDGETKTIIQTTGTNGGAAFVKPPTQWSGMAVRGDALQGTGVQMGANGAFSGLIHWSNIKVSNFDLAVDCYNFFICKWDSIYILSNNNGVRCIPTDSVGVDDGYFTTWEWSNVIVAGFGFNAPGYALLCEPALGGRLFQWNNVSFEKHGYGGSVAAMVILYSTNVVGKNVYLESSPVPAINNRFSNITLENVYMNGTQGITVGTVAAQAVGKTHLKNCAWITANDRTFYVSSGSGSEVVFENSGSTVPALTGSNPDRLIYINSGGYAFFSRFPKNLAGTEGNIRLGGTLATLNDIRCYTKTVSATVPASGTVDLIYNEFVNALWEPGVVGVASITSSFQPNVLLHVTPADTGSASYFCVRARNMTASPITLTNVQLTVTFYRHTGVAI